MVRLIVAGATLLVVWLGTDEVSGTPRESETYSLLLLGALGAVMLAGADDLLILAVAFLLASIPLYALIGMRRTSGGAEAALKTYLLGALLGIVLLLGMTLLNAVGGSTRYVDLLDSLPDAPTGVVALGAIAVLGGLLFKAGGVPAHFWVPDAAQGAGVTAAAFVTTVPKVGAVVAVYRLAATMPAASQLTVLIAVVAAASMTLGNLAAFFQSDPRRLLGWSTVSQVGYLLIPVAVVGGSALVLPALLVYLAGYAVSNVAAFAVTAALPEVRTLAGYRGLARRRPWLAGALLVSLLSLVGTPPTAVFVGKLTVFTAGWDGGAQWLVVLAVLNSVASLFYYLRWLTPMFSRLEASANGSSANESPAPESSANAAAVHAGAPAPATTESGGRAAVAGAVLVILLGVTAGLVLQVVG